MSIEFTTDYASILKQIDRIDPIKYGKTRNYINGAVTYLSPYISRGVISTKQILQSVVGKGFTINSIEIFIKELCWRDYFQRVGQEKDLNEDIKQAQFRISNNEIPINVINGTTGIEGIDNAINTLKEKGYMHNHCRMYTASIVCNIAQSHWKQPAQWMYYHLLDGDFASNICSWQWVAAANSNKKYYANQENINKFTFTNQQNSFLDTTYEILEHLSIPKELVETSTFNEPTLLPDAESISFDSTLPTFIYNYYNLDPLWHQTEKGNRILLLEPDHFKAYPISHKCVEFMLALSRNIPDLQVYIGSFKSFTEQFNCNTIYFKEHPFNTGYIGIEESRDWISPAITGYYPSFFAYWNKMEKQIKENYK
jgi:deoxyribodipyrimidine photo-lyase